MTEPISPAEMEILSKFAAADRVDVVDRWLETGGW